MKTYRISSFLLLLGALFSFAVFSARDANAQRRDYFTDEEIELVRDANQIDKRIAVLVKAIDRRFLVINKDNSQAKQIEKDSDKWGELPSGTRLELLTDISQILQKAIDDIDDLVARAELNERVSKSNVENDTDEVTKRIIKKNDEVFPRAVHDLADASRKYLPMLESLESGSTDQREKGVLQRSIESCNMIIEASTQIARPVDKKKKN